VDGGAADRARRQEAVRRAGGARAGAGLRRVTGTGRRAAHRAGVPRRMRAGRAGPTADVARAHVAVVGACSPVRLEGVGRTGGAGARSALGLGALARSRAADRARGLDGVGRTGRSTVSLLDALPI